MILRSQVRSSSKSENARGSSRSRKRGTSRQAVQELQGGSSLHNGFHDSEDTSMEDQAMLDRRAGNECVDQAHICDDPAWKVVDLRSDVNNGSEGRATGSMGEVMPISMGSESNPTSGALKKYLFKEEHDISFFKMCPKERRWIDFGPAIVTIEGGMYASTITVCMDKTFRILATWSVFGGMKVIRFLSTVIVLAVVPDDEGVHKIVSYGLKLATLEEAKGLAILLTSTTRGLQMNMDRLIPPSSAAQRATILGIMSDRLTALQRRLGEKQDSQLSIEVETELASMLSNGAELRR